MFSQPIYTIISPSFSSIIGTNAHDPIQFFHVSFRTDTDRQPDRWVNVLATRLNGKSGIQTTNGEAPCASTTDRTYWTVLRRLERKNFKREQSQKVFFYSSIDRSMLQFTIISNATTMDCNLVASSSMTQNCSTSHTSRNVRALLRSCRS